MDNSKENMKKINIAINIMMCLTAIKVIASFSEVVKGAQLFLTAAVIISIFVVAIFLIYSNKDIEYFAKVISLFNFVIWLYIFVKEMYK